MQNRVGQRLGKYRLISFLGAGGLASVFLAKHVALRTLVAIKVLNTRPSQANLQEIRNQALIVAPLSHPNILHVQAFEVEKNTSYLVMDYAPNGSLRDRYSKGQLLPLPTILMYVKQIANALQYLHDRNLIHLDVKPENMLLGSNYEILLSDFGLAMATPGDDAEKMEEIAGTPAYMAPEQFQGKPGPASDQYALGIVVYEWLCGTCPFDGSIEEIENQHLASLPRPLCKRLSSISPYVEAAVLTALAKDPRDRFASVQAFANALERASQLEVTRGEAWQQSPWGQQPAQTWRASSWGGHPTNQPSVVSIVPSEPEKTILRMARPPKTITITLARMAESLRQSKEEPQQIFPSTPRPFESLRQSKEEEPQQIFPISDSVSQMAESLRQSKKEEPQQIFPASDSVPQMAESLRQSEEEQHMEMHLTLFAIARALLEEDNTAFINTTYMLQTGISQQQPEETSCEPFDMLVNSSAQTLIFDILLHESENIELLTEWHQKLYYSPANKDLQSTNFSFRVISPGQNSLSVDFYHERHWLRTITVTFDGVEKLEAKIVTVEV